jgi:ribose/xylose/arabinose/galactoside ABC-type transport system permease subunit
VSFELYKGEILGYYGLVGSGKTEVARVLYGIDRYRGELLVKGKKAGYRKIRGAMRTGFTLIPEERRADGIFGKPTIRENIPMMRMKSVLANGLISRAKENRLADEYIKGMSIAAGSREKKVAFLSGGNQQKVVISKCLNRESDILLLDEPTRGVDVGAKQEIHDITRNLANRGKGIVVFSSELPEILHLVLFVVLNVYFTLTSPSFFQLENYFNVRKQVAPVLITASAAVVVLCGILIGTTNGFLVSRMNFPPSIATLGMMYVSRGVALIIAKGTTVREHIPVGITTLARGTMLGVPAPAYLIALFILLFLFVERKTLLGKYAMAIGGNRNAAFFSGINARSIVFWIYVVVGGLAAFSGVLTTSRLNAGDPRGGYGFEFDVILAILLGAHVVQVLKNGLDMLNILTFWQSILKDVIFIMAIVLNEKILKRVGKKKMIAAEA